MTTTSSISDLRAFEPCSLSALQPEPKVSVLLANYNYAGFVGQSIESVLAQTYANWELIICDDGSTDGSKAVIQSYSKGDSRIKFLSKANGGHASALNAAFSEGTGEIICLLDSDDLYLPTKLSNVVDACLRFPDAGVVSHAVIRVNEKRRQQGVWPLTLPPDGWLGPEVLQAGGILGYAPPTSGIALRRQIGEMLFPVSLDPPLSMCPDQVIMRLAPLITKLKRLPEALSEYRIHRANTYARQEMTLASVRKQLSYSRALWQEQHRFLSAMDPNLAEQLAPLGNSSFTALLEYFEAKLGGDPAVKKYHQAYLSAREAEGSTKFSSFWQTSIYLPLPIFRSAVSFLHGHGALKQFVARIKRLV